MLLQVRTLKQRCDLQDMEIKKLHKDAEGAALKAAQESSQCTKAKEVVNSIATQVRTNSCTSENFGKKVFTLSLVFLWVHGMNWYSKRRCWERTMSIYQV